MRDHLTRRTLRVPEYDYTTPGAYFITITSANRECIFASITAGRVDLSPLGAIVKDEWHRTAELRSHVEVDGFVIMPNHMHAILWIVSDADRWKLCQSGSLASRKPGHCQRSSARSSRW